jgi:hypothetical protein
LRVKCFDGWGREGRFCTQNLWIHIACAAHAFIWAVDLQYSKRPWSDHILSMNYFYINNTIKSMQNNATVRDAVQIEPATWLFKATDYCWPNFCMPTICSISLQRVNLYEYETCFILKKQKQNGIQKPCST